jgi:hypothetical protein
MGPSAGSGRIIKPSGNYVNVPVVIGLSSEEYSAYKVSKNQIK